MKAAALAARQVRAHYRHALRTLTYVTLDEANGGIVRNLSDTGIALQVVGALHPQQTVRLRFELTRPRVRVDAHGEVTWADSSGQCGIRFLDISSRTCLQLNQWIFGNLLELIPRDAAGMGLIFGSPAPIADVTEESDGLIVSSLPRPVIQLEPISNANLRPDMESESSPPPQWAQRVDYECIDRPDLAESSPPGVNWRPRPPAGRSLALLVDSLVVTAGFLVFAFVFLATTQELPHWPMTAVGFAAGGLFVTAAYWALVKQFGGLSLGRRVANLASRELKVQMEKEVNRFR
jgi:hypothetical protein